MLESLEIRELPLYCEWDEVTGDVGVAFGGSREVVWDRYRALVSSLSGSEWEDLEVRERVDTHCHGRSALSWRARFVPAATVRRVPELIMAAVTE